MLSVIVALVTLPLAVSTVITQMPVPVAWARLALYGYLGRGALIARAFAADSDVGVAGGGSGAFGRAIARFLTRVSFFALSKWVLLALLEAASPQR